MVLTQHHPKEHATSRCISRQNPSPASPGFPGFGTHQDAPWKSRCEDALTCQLAHGLAALDQAQLASLLYTTAWCVFGVAVLQEKRRDTHCVSLQATVSIQVAST